MTANDPPRPASRRKSALWSRIKDRDGAERVVQESRLAYYILAVVLLAIAIFWQNNVWIDALIYAALAFLLSRFQSRIAAVLLLLMALTVFIGTMMNQPAFVVQGRNALVGLFMVWTSARTVEATFKLHRSSFPKADEA